MSGRTKRNNSKSSGRWSGNQTPVKPMKYRGARVSPQPLFSCFKCVIWQGKSSIEGTQLGYTYNKEAGRGEKCKTKDYFKVRHQPL